MKGIDLVANVHIVVVAVAVGAAVVRSPTRTRQTGERRLLSVSETIASRPWQRTSYRLTVVDFRLRHHAVNEIVNAIVNVTEIVTWIVPPVPGATTTPSTIVSAETGRMRENVSIAVAPTEVRMMSSPMEMNAQQLLDVVDRKRKTIMPAGIPGIQRYVYNHYIPYFYSSCFFSHIRTETQERSIT